MQRLYSIAMLIAFLGVQTCHGAGNTSASKKEKSTEEKHRTHKKKHHAGAAHQATQPAKHVNLAKSSLYDNMLFVDADGKSHNLRSWNDSHGGKFVLLVVWASWCGPCVRELPTVNALYDSPLRNHLEIIPVAIEAPVSGHAYSLDDITMPLFYSETLSVFMSKEGVHSIPTAFLYAPNGDLIMKESGARNWNSERSKLMLEKAFAQHGGKHHGVKRKK